MELLYNEQLGKWRSGLHAQDSGFVRTARIKSENLEMILDSLNPSQKEWLECYEQAKGK